ncbi:hypothetical protein QOZ95_001285 [Paenibacillus brasilensis]|uniref:Secreted protein n=1 Tax=Paenibacillus brasilensis TaxID=128574 RepID=A0ABU0KUL0_9BACL|nr:hypothetical protein [Paenibacillus brasilensis]
MTSPMVSTVTAVLLCSRAVMHELNSKPRQGETVARFSQRVRKGPAKWRRAASISFIPPKKISSPPHSGKITCINMGVAPFSKVI